MDSWKKMKIADTDISDLQNQVTTFIDNGYTLVGDIRITTFDDNSVLYVQTLVKGNMQRPDAFNTAVKWPELY